MLVRIQREDNAITRQRSPVTHSPIAQKLRDGITALDAPLTGERIGRSGTVESLRKPFEEQGLLDAIHRAV
jgi:hypothetical protein